MTEDERVGWHHQLDGHEFEQVPRVGDGQGSLACCSPWGSKEPDTTEQLNGTRDCHCSVFNIYFYLFDCTRASLQHVGSSSLTKDQTQGPCIGSSMSYPVDHQASPHCSFYPCCSYCFEHFLGLLAFLLTKYLPPIWGIDNQLPFIS